MILIDISQIMWAGIHSQSSDRVDIDEDLIRHVVLNSIRSIRSRYCEQYGEIVICADSKHYWRKRINKYYKSNRKKAREKSKMDFGAIYSALDKLKKDLSECFPYTCVEVDGAEADDVQYHLARLYASRDNPCLLVSNDHDMIQALQFDHVTILQTQKQKLIKRRH